MRPTSTPNAVQKKWREDVRAIGSVISGEKPAEIHHPAGRTAKHNKVAIGHWWVLPLTTAEHKLLGSDKHTFDSGVFGFVLGGRWDAEKLLFQAVIEKVGYAPPDEVVAAILDYRRA